VLIGNLDEMRQTGSPLYDLVRKFARGHVSRFPMKFEFTEQSVNFYDSRFTTEVGKLYRDKGQFVVHSKLIGNGKYSEGNSKYHTRATSSQNTMSKYLETYIQPVAPINIWKMYDDSRTNLFNKWRSELNDLASKISMTSYYGNSAEIVRAAFVKDLINHILYGTMPYSHPDLAQFKTKEFAEACLENERRRAIPKPTNHIFINPDETVVHWDGTFAHSHNTINEIGDELHSKLSLVKMLESNQMIGEVGMKVSPVSFWLYQ
jgi:hypothetical protein